MSNMSYCRFENTCTDLQDCVEVLEYKCEFQDLSKSEQHYALKMRDLCKQYLEATESFEK